MPLIWLPALPQPSQARVFCQSQVPLAAGQRAVGTFNKGPRGCSDSQRPLCEKWEPPAREPRVIAAVGGLGHHLSSPSPKASAGRGYGQGSPSRPPRKCLPLADGEGRVVPWFGAASILAAPASP